MADGTIPPSYYTLDITGQLSINIDGDAPPINDLIQIVVSSSDGVSSNHVQTTASFRVLTTCGLTSTTVIAPL